MERTWSVRHDRCGYQILFNGQTVGGAGTIHPYKRTPANVRFHSEQAALCLAECKARDMADPFDPDVHKHIHAWLRSSEPWCARGAGFPIDKAAAMRHLIRLA